MLLFGVISIRNLSLIYLKSNLTVFKELLVKLFEFAFFHKVLTCISLSAVATSDTYRVACHKYQPHRRPIHPSPHAPQQRGVV